VRQSGVLDANSAYLYLLLCRDFSDSCLVACQNDSVIGFVTGYRLPCDPAILFVWQVGVVPEAMRQGVATTLLCELVKRSGRPAVSAIEATVAKSNTASRRLFESLAQTLGVPLVDQPNQGFIESDFPSGDHEAEPRIHIGPLR
jgi:L-2,4-diaminobutyric acid acetyltransferase